MKTVIIATLALALSACGSTSTQGIPSINGIGVTEVCIDGVRHIRFPGGVTTRAIPNGTVNDC